MKQAFYIICIGIVCLNSIQVVEAQKSKSKANTSNTLKDYFDDALYFYGIDDYKEALFNYLKIYEKMPDNANINFWIGMCYLKIQGEETKAIPYFEKAITKITVDYKKNTFEETRAPLYAYFYLGNAYRINNQPDRAIEMYNRFRNHPSFENRYNARMVEEEIVACERAKIIQAMTQPVKIENINSPINNSSANYKPVVNSDETVMIFMTSLKFYEAIMMSKKVDGKWTEPVNISPQVGSDGDCEPSCLSADGNELYLIKKTKGNADIYVSSFDGTKWSLMKPLGKNVNSTKNEISVSISRDGQSLYFSSDRRGGYGGYDIYYSTRTSNNDWGSAVNLGKIVNTALNEINPYICDDGKTLIFSSEGHLSMGGYDLFVTQLITNKWSEPINIGYPVNTTSNDIYYYPLRNGEIGYIYANKPDGSGGDDIYRIENITLHLLASESIGKPDKVKKVIIRDKLTNDILGYVFSVASDSLKKKTIMNTQNFKIENQ